MKIRMSAAGSEFTMSAQIAKGFTLLEILLVMTLATLILTVVSANFSVLVPGMEQQAQVRYLVSALRAARSTAVSEQREVALLLDLKQRQYRIEGAEQITQLPETLQLGFFPVLPATTNESTKVIRFFADGSSTGGVIDMVTDEVAYRVTIDWLTGRIGYAETV